jgi:hypothetical protein
MRKAYDGCLCDGGVANESAFNFSSADAMAGDVKDIIDAACDPNVAIVITLAAIT